MMSSRSKDSPSGSNEEVSSNQVPSNMSEPASVRSSQGESLNVGGDDDMSKDNPLAIRGQSFASTCAGSPYSATDDGENTPPGPLSKASFVFDRQQDSTLRFRTPLAQPADGSNERASTVSAQDASAPSWTRFRFASCLSGDLTKSVERRPSTADVISRYESLQSSSYKEYRRWKESKWGEDALDEVEFEDDDVNLELNIPAVFSVPILQFPSLAEAFRNFQTRIVGYLISIGELLINADYYLRHPKEALSAAICALWILLPSPPKYIIDSFMSVATSTDEDPLSDEYRSPYEVTQEDSCDISAYPQTETISTTSTTGNEPTEECWPAHLET
eukprot:Blabericola_migrator_1__7138@NODE_3615_length_1631_cov_304_744885_g403_i2_p1_GENE_NODE_3615_length_1631_cov_304_744885_g403_i2NODE_3615_length_1631_cov_304_744885_g403_i2_p1_ORF_typecomplete_len332_score34_42_NODE_3615_length_1631_cov_304_744885_g403_i22611256